MSTFFPLVFGIAALCTSQFLAVAFDLDAWNPDLLALVMIWLGTARGLRPSSAVFAVILGALADGFSGSPLGLHMVQSVLLLYVSIGLGNRVRFQGVFGWTLLGAIGALVNLVILVAVARLFLGGTLLGERIAAVLLPRVGAVVLCAPLVLPVLSRLDEFSSKRPEGDVI
jgi:cell shape-determining protein MreD